MAILVNRYNAHAHARELDLAHQFRHEIFVEGMQWDALRRHDGREKDQFDNEEAVHVIGLDGETVQFYARFLPTTHPHLLSHVYPEIMQGYRRPVAPHIWEQSRTTLMKRRLPNGKMNPVSARLTLAGIEAALFIGAQLVIVETTPMFIAREAEIGYRPLPLCLPIQAYGQEMIVTQLTVDMTTLGTARRYYDHWSAVLTYNGALVMDLMQERVAA